MHGRLAVVLAEAVLQEVHECLPLAFGAGGDCGIIGSHDWTCYRTSSSELRTQIRAGQVCDNLFKRPEKEHFVFDNGSTESSAKLVATKVLERFAIRGSRGQRFRAEIFETASVDLIRSGLGNDVDNAPGCPTEFRVCPACDDLKFLDRVERNVNCGTLSAQLLAEEAVVVVAAVEAYVIENATLAVEIDLVAVRALGNAYTGG